MICGDVTDRIPVGALLGLFEAAADDGDDLDAVDLLDTVEVLLTEGAGAGDNDFHFNSSR